MAKTLELWSPETIEEALGVEAAGVLPEAVRLIDLHVRLPYGQGYLFSKPVDAAAIEALLAKAPVW